MTVWVAWASSILANAVPLRCLSRWHHFCPEDEQGRANSATAHREKREGRPVHVPVAVTIAETVAPNAKAPGPAVVGPITSAHPTISSQSIRSPWSRTPSLRARPISEHSTPERPCRVTRFRRERAAPLCPLPRLTADGGMAREAAVRQRTIPFEHMPT